MKLTLVNAARAMIVCYIFLSFGLSVQTQQPVTAKRIYLDVLVSGRSGQPVSALEPLDFTILDNKVPQKLLSFHHYAARSENPELPVEVVLVVDGVNSSFQSMIQERQKLTTFLRSNGGRLATPTTLILLTDTSMKVQPHPSLNGNALARALERSHNPLHTYISAEGRSGDAERTYLCLKYLEKITSILSSRPGRKVVVWISHGWPTFAPYDPTMTSSELPRIFNTIVQLSTQLREARVTLYNVDPQGPVQGENPIYYQGFLKPVTAPTQAAYPNLMLEVIATQSGGRVVNTDSDLVGNLRLCLNDLGAWYTVSFNAPQATGPNEYHSIEIKINQPGLTVHTNSGYYSQP